MENQNNQIKSNTTYYMPPPEQQPKINVQYAHPPPATGFGVYNENDPRYLCCCGGRCHSRTGAMIIATLYFLESGSNLSIFALLFFHASHGPLPLLFYVGLILTIAVLVIDCVFIYGVLKERHYFVLPFMVLQILTVVFYAIVALVAVLALTSSIILPFLNDDKNDPLSDYEDIRYKDNRRKFEMILILYCVGALVICGLCVALHVWWFMVILKCYRYIRDKRATFVPYSAPLSQQQGAAVRMY